MSRYWPEKVISSPSHCIKLNLSHSISNGTVLPRDYNSNLVLQLDSPAYTDRSFSPWYCLSDACMIRTWTLFWTRSYDSAQNPSSFPPSVDDLVEATLSRSPLRRAAVSFSTAQILMVSLVTFPHPIFYIFSSSLIQQMVTDSELRWCKLTLVFIKLTTAQTEPSSLPPSHFWRK
jgi:hypothetical protein